MAFPRGSCRRRLRSPVLDPQQRLRPFCRTRCTRPVRAPEALNQVSAALNASPPNAFVTNPPAPLAAIPNLCKSPAILYFASNSDAQLKTLPVFEGLAIAQSLSSRVGCWRKHNNLERGGIWHSFNRRSIVLEDLQFCGLTANYME